MNTRRKIVKTRVKNRLRRRYIVKKNQKKITRKRTSTILPLILATLLLLNFGLFVYLINQDNIDKDLSIFELVTDVLNIKKTSAEKPEPIIEIHPPENNPEDYGEFETSRDEIIDFLEEYENLIIVESGESNLENIPDPIGVDKFSVDKEKDYILTYHTHSTESFLVDSGKYNNTNPSENIIAIGETFSTVLSANDHKVNHNRDFHDLPSYSQSYSRSKNTIIKNREENPNLKVFFDIHRDGRDEDSPDLEKFLAESKIDIEGVSTATFALVVGPDAENFDQLLSFAKYIKAVSDVIYPGLCKGIIVKPIGRYNLYFSDYSALLELGSNWVTIEETHETGKRVAEILSLVLDKLIIE